MGFYTGDPKGVKAKIGSGKTGKPILPGGYDDVEIKWDAAPATYFTGATAVFGIVDDDPTPHTWHECKTDDNTSALFAKKCSG